LLLLLFIQRKTGVHVWFFLLLTACREKGGGYLQYTVKAAWSRLCRRNVGTITSHSWRRVQEESLSNILLSTRDSSTTHRYRLACHRLIPGGSP